MVDLSLLRTELDKPAYVGLSNADAAAAVMVAVIAADRVVPTAEIGRLWARRGVTATARTRANTTALTVAQRTAAWKATEILDRDGFADLDPRDTAQRAAMVALFDDLIANAVMTEADKTATIALINKTRTGREVFGQIDENDVAQARAL